MAWSDDIERLRDCHAGAVNQTLHALGVATIAWGVMERSVALVLVAFVMQESGHVYESLWIRKSSDHLRACLRFQAPYVLPAFAAIIAYILLA